LRGELGSDLVGLITVGVMAGSFAFVVDDEGGAKDLRIWAANSARVAGKGRPGRCGGGRGLRQRWLKRQ
jgi:hypothetical protein